jgi:tripartite-type tricarboxylate transporter receptor subunit TctC
MPFAIGRCLAAIAALLAALSPAAGQQYPSRNLMLVVPNPAGGSVDLVARAVADTMSKSLGQTVVVENRAAGASGTVASRQVARSAPDGYTLLLGYTGNLGTGPSLYRNVGYEPRRDFAAIGLIASAPSLVLAHPSISARDPRELIALMKAAAKPYQVGSPGTGSVNYLTAAIFAERAGVKIQQIPYKGSHNMMTDLIGGHIKLGFSPIPVSRAAIESKLVRALAATSLRRSSFMPDLPTVAEAGLAGFDAVLTYGLVAPAGTPQAIVERLNAALKAALASEMVGRRLVQDGAEPMPGTPEEHAAVIDREATEWAAAVKLAGLQPQ